MSRQEERERMRVLSRRGGGEEGGRTPSEWSTFPHALYSAEVCVEARDLRKANNIRKSHCMGEIREGCTYLSSRSLRGDQVEVRLRTTGLSQLPSSLPFELGPALCQMIVVSQHF